MSVYNKFLQRKNKNNKSFALLVDPDKVDSRGTAELARLAEKAGVDFFFVGGSLLTRDCLDECIKALKKNSSIPVILFPGNTMQISNEADAILFLSLISGRNPEMLIGKHVIAAPYLKASGLEVIPTGYMLIESGTPTAVSYMSYTTPIPADKNDIALCTALAGEYLGLKCIFMDAGSGALSPIRKEMISKVRASISAPLIIGGGIKTPEKAAENCKAGADIIVVGNSIEKDPGLISELCSAVHS
jgi:putative glycerol-1-phosphate prenyltransferase